MKQSIAFFLISVMFLLGMPIGAAPVLEQELTLTGDMNAGHWSITNIDNEVAVGTITAGAFAGDGHLLTGLPSSSVNLDPAEFGTNSSGYYDLSTNWLALHSVSSSITNGLATVASVVATSNWVAGQGYVTSSVTNGLASTSALVSAGSVMSNTFATSASLATVVTNRQTTAAGVNWNWTVGGTETISNNLEVLGTAGFGNGAVYSDTMGDWFATSFNGSGAGLTLIPASNLVGTLPLSNLPAAVVTNGSTNIQLTGQFTGSGVGLTNVPPAALQQDGATLNQGIGWNGATWVPTTFSSGSGGIPTFGGFGTNTLLTNASIYGSSIYDTEFFDTNGNPIIILTNLPPQVVTNTQTNIVLGGSFTGIFEGEFLGNIFAQQFDSVTIGSRNLNTNRTPLIYAGADFMFPTLSVGYNSTSPLFQNWMTNYSAANTQIYGCSYYAPSNINIVAWNGVKGICFSNDYNWSNNIHPFTQLTAPIPWNFPQNASQCWGSSFSIWHDTIQFVSEQGGIITGPLAYLACTNILINTLSITNFAVIGNAITCSIPQSLWISNSLEPNIVQTTRDANSNIWACLQVSAYTNGFFTPMNSIVEFSPNGTYITNLSFNVALDNAQGILWLTNGDFIVEASEMHTGSASLCNYLIPPSGYATELNRWIQPASEAGQTPVPAGISLYPTATNNYIVAAAVQIGSASNVIIYMDCSGVSPLFTTDATGTIIAYQPINFKGATGNIGESAPFPSDLGIDTKGQAFDIYDSLNTGNYLRIAPDGAGSTGVSLVSYNGGMAGITYIGDQYATWPLFVFGPITGSSVFATNFVGLGPNSTVTASNLIGNLTGNAATATVASNLSMVSTGTITINGTNAATGQVLTATDGSGHVAFAPASASGSTNAVTTNVSGAYSSLMPATNLSGTINPTNLPPQVVTNTQTNIVYGFFTNSTENIINIQSCGAIPSGQIANYCAIATGGTALVREDGLAFTYGDVGKIIKITQAGSGGINDFTTGIAAWVTNNQVTLSNAVPFGISNTFAIYGYDSTAGITNALAVASNSLINGRNVTLLVPDGIYMVNGPLLDTGGFSNHHNAQLVLPVMPVRVSGNTSPTLTITGCSPPQASYYAVSNYSTAFGAVFWSTLVSVPNGRFIDAMGDGSSGPLSGGPSTGSYTVLANPLRVNIQRMTFLVPVNSNLRILDCEGALGAQFGELNLGTGQGQFVCMQPTNYWSAALVTPGSGSIGDVNIKDIWINGMFNGLIPSEHVCQNGELNINCCVNAIEVTNGFGHPAVFQNCEIASCKNGIVLGANSGARIYGVFAIEDTATNYWSYPMNVFANGGVNGQGLIGEEWISYSMSAPPTNIGTVPALCHYNQAAGINSYSPSLGAANYTVGAPFVQTNLGVLFESYPDANYDPGFFINQTNAGQRSILRFSTADNVEWDILKTDTSDQLWFRVVGAGVTALILDAVNQSISFYPSWPISGLGSGLTGTATALSIGGNAATATVASNATTSTSSNSSVTISVSVNPKGQTNYDLAVSSNYFSPLASNGLAVNMNLAWGTNSQSANFTFTAPTNVNMADFNSSVLIVTNSSGSPIQATAASGWHTNGTFTVTNISSFTVTIVPGWFTNVICFNLY